MSLKIHCDRCKTTEAPKVSFDLPLIPTGWLRLNNMDLCKACVGELDVFLKSPTAPR